MARPRSRVDTVTASHVANRPNSESGARQVNAACWRIRPSTTAPSAMETLPRAVTSPPTWALEPSRTEPSIAITLPLTWPSMVIPPSSTMTSPKATPSIRAVPCRTTTSSTSRPRATSTVPDRTIWSSASRGWAAAPTIAGPNPRTNTTSANGRRAGATSSILSAGSTGLVSTDRKRPFERVAGSP